jgi:hypothetical protein
VMEEEERIKALDGIGCRPVLLSATTEELLDWIGDLPSFSQPFITGVFSVAEISDRTSISVPSLELVFDWFRLQSVRG